MNAWQTYYFSASDGLKLACRRYGWSRIEAPVVVCLPGLSRNAADFHDLAMHLSQTEKRNYRVLVFEYRGRGSSAYDRNWENYNILTEADDVVQGMIASGVTHADIVGTSRGGLITMVLAAMKPGMLGKIVMNDIGPEIEGPGLVRIKNMIEGAKPEVSGWDEAVSSLKLAGKHDFPKRTDKDWEEQARLIYVEADGRIRRNYDPKLANTMKAMDLDQPVPSMWPQFRGLSRHKLLLIRGANSDLIAATTVEKMKSINPRMQEFVVPDQGHAPDLGTPGIPERISAFLSK